MRLQSEHMSKMKKVAEDMRSAAGETISATSFLSDVAKQQTERIAAERKINAEREQNHQLEQSDKAMHDR